MYVIEVADHGCSHICNVRTCTGLDVHMCLCTCTYVYVCCTSVRCLVASVYMFMYVHGHLCATIVGVAL